MQVQMSAAGFKEWLETRQPTAIVGYARDMCNCPIARYYTDLSGMQRSIMPDKSIPWLYAFIVAVDKHPTGTRITAAEALEILAQGLTSYNLFRIIIAQ